MLLGAVTLASSPAMAQTTNAQKLQELQAQIARLQQMLWELRAAEATSTDAVCLQLQSNLTAGDEDASTDGAVSYLQRFLQRGGYFTYPQVTGFYGQFTVMAVQAWQRHFGIVSGGTLETTGYGAVGPRTRAAMSKLCSEGTSEFDTKFSVSSRDLRAKAQFTLPRNCARYTLSWGDNSTEVSGGENKSTVCGSTSDITFSHNYKQDGTYTVALTVWTGSTSQSMSKAISVDRPSEHKPDRSEPNPEPALPVIEKLDLSGVSPSSCTFPLPPKTSKDTIFFYDKAYATIGGKTLRYDLALPRTKGRYPLLVLIHGGAFQLGDKSEKFPQELLRSIAGQGYAVATIQYRLATSTPGLEFENKFPSAIQDVRCAIRGLTSGTLPGTEFGDEFGQYIDTDKVGVLGTSAGGHLSLLMATAADVKEFDSADCPYGNERVEIQAAATFFPSVRFISNAGRKWSNYGNTSTSSDSYIILGKQPSAVEELIRLGSPLYHLEQYDAATDPMIPPILFGVSGRERNPYLVTNANLFEETMKEKDLPHIFFTEADAYHGYQPFSDFRQSACYTMNFFDTVLKDN